MGNWGLGRTVLLGGVRAAAGIWSIASSDSHREPNLICSRTPTQLVLNFGLAVPRPEARCDNLVLTPGCVPPKALSLPQSLPLHGTPLIRQRI